MSLSHPSPAPAPPRVRLNWFDKFSYITYCLFTLEVGLFLLVYPWLPAVWSQNFFFHLVPEWRPLFMSNYFRGAVSGLGVINLFISASHTLRLRQVLSGR